MLSSHRRDRPVWLHVVDAVDVVHVLHVDVVDVFHVVYVLHVEQRWTRP
jgi:hypothetical protein